MATVLILNFWWKDIGVTKRWTLSDPFKNIRNFSWMVSFFKKQRDKEFERLLIKNYINWKLVYKTGKILNMCRECSVGSSEVRILLYGNLEFCNTTYKILHLAIMFLSPLPIFIATFDLFSTFLVLFV